MHEMSQTVRCMRASNHCSKYVIPASSKLPTSKPAICMRTDARAGENLQGGGAFLVKVNNFTWHATSG